MVRIVVASKGDLRQVRPGLAARVNNDYLRISSDCALVTATDSKHAPYLFNAIASIHRRFPDHPVLHVFDLGMNRMQRRELSGVRWIQLRGVERFVKHWKQNWSWKPYILTQVKQRYVLYFDAANIVLYRPLLLWYRAIQSKGYFLIENGQTMDQITPPDYWKLFGFNETLLANAPTFGAGLLGFDRYGFAGDAMDEVLARTIEGWTLGRSAQETRRTYDSSVIRECPCFRADQTLFNLAFRKHCRGKLVLRDELRYCGRGGPSDHRRQYLWYSRRQRSSLIYFWQPMGEPTAEFFLNRLMAYVTILTRYLGGRLLRLLPSRRP
jgi:hypothetical protein